MPTALMNCLLCCIIYVLLSPSTFTSDRPAVYVKESKSREKRRQSISIILFFKPGYLTSHQADSLLVSCSITFSISPVFSAHYLPVVASLACFFALTLTLGKYCFANDVQIVLQRVGWQRCLSVTLFQRIYCSRCSSPLLHELGCNNRHNMSDI